MDSEVAQWALLRNVVLNNFTMPDYESNEEREFKESKTNSEEALDDAGEELENAGDKVKAGAKAVGNKLADPDRNLETEYQKEKIKEKLD
jgi:hypothetical protein